MKIMRFAISIKKNMVMVKANLLFVMLSCLITNNISAYDYFIIKTRESFTCNFCKRSYAAVAPKESPRTYYLTSDDKRKICLSCQKFDYDQQLIKIALSFLDSEDLKYIEESSDIIKVKSITQKLINNEKFQAQFPRFISLGFQKNLENICTICIAKVNCCDAHYFCENGHFFHESCGSKLLSYKGKKCPICKKIDLKLFKRHTVSQFSEHCKEALFSALWHIRFYRNFKLP